MFLGRILPASLICCGILAAQQDLFQSSVKASATVGSRVEAVAFSPDGKWLAVGTKDGQTLVMDVASGGSFRPAAKLGSRVTGLVFTPDTSVLVAASSGGQIQVIAMGDTPSLSREIPVRGKTRSIAVSTGGLLMVSSEDNTVTAWSLATGQKLYALSSNSKKPFKSLGFAPGGSSVVGVTELGHVWEWDINTRSVLRHLEDPDRNVHASASGNASHYFSISTEVIALNKSSLDNGRGGSAPPSAGRVSVGGPGGGGGGGIGPSPFPYRQNSIKIYDLSQGKLAKTLDGMDGEVTALSMSADDRFVAIVRQRIRDSFLDVIDSDRGVPAVRIPLQGFGTAVAFSPDARWLASANDHGEVTIYAVTGVQRGTAPGNLSGRKHTITSKQVEPLISLVGALRLAIMDFDASQENKDLGRSVADMVRNRINGATNLEIVERQEWDKLVNEQNLTRSDRIDPDTAVRLGRGHGVQKIIFGRVTKLDKSYTINVRMVDVETGREEGVREVLCQACGQDDLPETVALLRTALIRD